MRENKDIVFKHICREDTYMFNYTQLPDELFTNSVFINLSLHAKVLYSFMLRRVSISKNNNWIDDFGDVYIFYRADEIMEKFQCSNKTAAKIMAELETIGLIEKKRQGQGKPDIIYVNKFSTIVEDACEEPDLPIENPELLHTENEEQNCGEIEAEAEVKNVHFQKCKNFTSKSVKSTFQEVNFLHTNYKENNYKDLISSSHSMDAVRMMEEEEEKYKRQIKYQEAERRYSAQIANAAYVELMKRDESYRKMFDGDMFLRVCKTVASSREPVLSMPGLLNWCFDHVNLTPPLTPTKKFDQYNQFMHTKYDFDALEKELLDN